MGIVSFMYGNQLHFLLFRIAVDQTESIKDTILQPTIYSEQSVEGDSDEDDSN